MFTVLIMQIFANLFLFVLTTDATSYIYSVACSTRVLVFLIRFSPQKEVDFFDLFQGPSPAETKASTMAGRQGILYWFFPQSFSSVFPYEFIKILVEKNSIFFVAFVSVYKSYNIFCVFLKLYFFMNLYNES